MKCMNCGQDWSRKYITLCHECKRWCCRECNRDHKPCNPLPSSNRQDTALVRPESQFDSGQELLPFDPDLFREFQGALGCEHTSERATELWATKVRAMLTRKQCDAILQVWAMEFSSSLPPTRTHSQPVIQEGQGDMCMRDRICNQVFNEHAVFNECVKSKGSEMFIG